MDSLFLLKTMSLKSSSFWAIDQNGLASKSASVLRKHPDMFYLRIHADLDVFFLPLHILECSLHFIYLHRTLNHNFYVILFSASYMGEGNISLEINR